MAQTISNKVQSTNPLAGLLGLSPAPKAPPSIFGNTQTTTPTMAKSNAQPFSIGTAGGGASVPLLGGPLAQKVQMTTGLMSSPQASAVPVSRVTPQSQAASTAPVSYQPSPGAQIPAPPPPQQPTTRGLFPDVASSLAYAAPKQNTNLGSNASAITDKYTALINPILKGTIGQEIGNRTSGAVTQVGEGNAAAAAQAGGSLIQGLTNQEQQELSGNAQGLTAQGQTQSALTSAGNLTQPYPTGYGQTSFTPGSGFDNTGGGLPAEVMQQYAQMASSGQYSAIPSFITSNPVLNAQLNVAAKALNPNYTPVGASGASSVLQGIPALQSANTAAEGIKNTIQTYIQANPQLNPSDLAAGNLLQQWIQGKQLTDPKYQTLFNYLNEYTNTLAPILGVGGDATNLKTQIAQGFVNAAASGQSISQVLESMSQLASHKITDLQSGAVGGGTAVPAPAAAGGAGSFAEAW